MELSQAQQPILVNTSVHGQFPPSLFSSRYGQTAGSLSQKAQSSLDKRLKKSWKTISSIMKRSVLSSKGGSSKRKTASKKKIDKKNKKTRKQKK